MKNKKILIADDDIQIRRSLAIALGDLGYIVNSAENGEKALELIQTNTPDLLITDWDMPVANGYKILERLQEKGYTIPVIINSGGAGPDIDYLKNEIYKSKLTFRSKSSSLNDLYKKIEEFLE